MKKRPNNPAGRLLLLINKLKSIDKSKTTDEALAEALGVDSSNTSKLMLHIGEFLKLGDKVKETIEQQDVNFDTFVKHIDEIILVFRKINLSAPIYQIQQQLKDGLIVGLEFCDELLSRNASEKTFNKNKLEAIHEEICSLINEVVKSDIDEYLKQYLLDKLDLLRQAVEMYDISGIRPIEDALNGVIGSACTDKKIQEKIGLTSLGKSFIKIVIGLYIAIQCINNIAQLPENIQKLLPGSKAVATEIIESQPAEKSINNSIAIPLQQTEDAKKNNSKK